MFVCLRIVVLLIKMVLPLMFVLLPLLCVFHLIFFSDRKLALPLIILLHRMYVFPLVSLLPQMFLLPRVHGMNGHCLCLPIVLTACNEQGLTNQQ